MCSLVRGSRYVFRWKADYPLKDLRVHKVLEELVRFGAPQDILYTAHPHIGTDLLRDIVKRLREEIIALGGEVRFSSCLQDLIIEQGSCAGLLSTMRKYRWIS